MKAKTWLAGWAVLVVAALGLIGYEVYKVDPYFHYHKPDTSAYYYVLNNQRSQNDGISKHFDYNALITGTSMTENFKTSEFDEIFDVHSVKVSYSGGSYKEMNDNLKIALRHNPNLKTIVRCLDMGFFSIPRTGCGRIWANTRPISMTKTRSMMSNMCITKMCSLAVFMP